MKGRTPRLFHVRDQIVDANGRPTQAFYAFLNTLVTNIGGLPGERSAQTDATASAEAEEAKQIATKSLELAAQNAQVLLPSETPDQEGRIARLEQLIATTIDPEPPRQQVFFDIQPDIKYPAISFMPVAGVDEVDITVFEP